MLESFAFAIYFVACDDPETPDITYSDRIDTGIKWLMLLSAFAVLPVEFILSGKVLSTFVSALSASTTYPTSEWAACDLRGPKCGKPCGTASRSDVAAGMCQAFGLTGLLGPVRPDRATRSEKTMVRVVLRIATRLGRGDFRSCDFGTATEFNAFDGGSGPEHVAIRHCNKFVATSRGTKFIT